MSAALDAIAKVVADATAGHAETEIVDFKQEAGTIVRGGRRVAVGTQHESAAQALAAQVACMAMSEHAGVLVGGRQRQGSRTRSVRRLLFGPALAAPARLRAAVQEGRTAPPQTLNWCGRARSALPLHD